MGDTEVTLLGPVSVLRGGQEVGLGPPRQRTLFAVLAAHTNQFVSRDELVTAVWGLDAPVTAINSVYTYVARLRRRLEPTRSRRAASDLLVSDSLGYKLQLPPDQVDVKRFESHLKRARSLHRTRAAKDAVREIDAALALWSGTPYGGTAGAFAEAERRTLTELRLAAIEDRVELLYQLEQGSDLVGELPQLAAMVRKHPLRERMRHLLMLGYAQCGRQADAIEEYHDLRGRLAEDQGLEPGERIQRLYEELLRSGAGTRAVPPPQVSTEAAMQRVALAQLPRNVPDFTGRSAELRELHRLVKHAERKGESGVILINGAPGIGKTALAVRVAHALRERFPDGQLELDLRGYGDGPGPMGLEEALRHLLDALGVPAPSAMDLERQCAVFRGLVAGRRLLVLLDNANSVSQVRPLLPGDASCLVIVTSRNSLTGLTVRDGARRITLVGMTEDGIELLGRMVGRQLVGRARHAARRLVEACGGIPLALRIAATRMTMCSSPEDALIEFADDDLLGQLDVLGDEHSSLRTVFSWSYAALSEEARQMFRSLGSGAKPGVTLKSAAVLAGVTPQVARCRLDVLVEANLIREPVQDHFQMNALLFAYAQHLSEAPPTFNFAPSISC
ncbi:hypothetical protein ADL21_00180 [Streptomyces albus subsp. albus]|nr:hypothetical protein ADL21_00180 [Streptomyces albus subsp. albus]